MESSEANELLASERARIERALSDAIAAAGDEQGESLDSGEGASELIETEIDESLAASLREQLAALERAERRLAEGRYGISVQSGEPIPDARLRSIPWAERTAAEQARYESGG